MSMCLEVHVTVGIRTFTDKKYSKKYFFCQIILTDRGVVDNKFYFVYNKSLFFKVFFLMLEVVTCYLE